MNISEPDHSKIDYSILKLVPQSYPTKVEIEMAEELRSFIKEVILLASNFPQHVIMCLLHDCTLRAQANSKRHLLPKHEDSKLRMICMQFLHIELDTQI